MKLFKQFSIARPEPREMMQEALTNYQRSLIDMEAQATYTRKMTEWYQENIARLQSQLGHDQPNHCSNANA